MRLINKLILVSAVSLAVHSNAQFTVQATVQHIDPTGGGSGNIILNVSGGGTYNYSWTPIPSTSSSITSVGSGSYACSIKSGAVTQTYTYNLGYKALWNTFPGATFRNDSLFLSTHHLDWNAAVSRNTLLGGNDGWAEIVLQSVDNRYMLGFVDSISPIPGIFSDIDFGFYVNNDNLFSVIDGNLTFVSNLAVGDVLHIERSGGKFYLSQNGSITYSTSMSSTTDYKLKAELDLDPMVNIGASFADSTSLQFPGYIQDISLVRHATPGVNNGTITLTPKEANGVHTYSWTNVSSTSSVVSSLTANIVYSVEATDNSSNHNKQRFDVGYRTYWKDLYGVTFRNDSLIYDPVSLSSSQMGNAISKNTLASNMNGWVEIVSDSWDQKFALGFADSIVPIADDNNDIDAGFMAYNSSLYSFVNGTAGWLSYFIPGDILRIERRDSLFILEQNSVTMYTLVISKSANYKLKASGYFGPTTSPLVNIGASFKDTSSYSFPGYVQDIPYIKHSSSLGVSDGSITLSPRYIESGHSYTWTTISEYSASINSKDRDTYNVIIKDANNNTSSYDYDIEYKTYWQNLEGNIVRNDSIISQYPYTATNWCTALSRNILGPSSDGEISWVNTDDGKDVIIGFLDVPTGSVGVYTDIDYGILKTSGNIFYRYRNGSFDGPGFSAVHGDVIKIRRTGNLMEYLINNTAICSNTVSASSNWKVKMAQYAGTSVADIGVSFYCDYPAISYSATSFTYPNGSPNTFSVTQTGATGGTYSYISGGTSTLNINSSTGLITASLSSYDTYTVIYTMPESIYCYSDATATTVITLIDGNCSLAIEPNMLSLCVGMQAQLNVFGGTEGYTWTPSTNLSCNTCSNPVLTYSDDVNTYTVISTKSGQVCGSATINIAERNCEDNTIFGCCFSNYGAAVYLNDSTTRINIYCNLVNEIVYDPVDTIKKGEFVNKGNVNVLLDWIHNGRNNLYTTSEGRTDVFGADEKLKGNSKTHYYYLKTGGNGTKTMYISEYGDSSLNLSSNVLALQNYNFYMTSMDADVQRTTGFASTGVSGYFARTIHTQSTTPANGYLFPLGAKASSVTPYRYRPLVMSNNSNSQTEDISVNFMNASPSLTDNAFVNPNYSNTVTTKAPSVYQTNTAFYHKIKNTVPPGIYSDLLIRSYYYPSDGSYQSMAEWKKDPAQPTDWWSTTPGAAGSNVTSTLSGTYGEIYAQTSGTQTFSNTPYVLSRGGFYVNTGQFGNGNNAIISLTAAPINTANPQPQGGGLGQPFGVGQNGGNLGNGAPLVITPNPVAGTYTINVTPANDCETPGMIKFTIDQNGVITPTSILYGVPSQTAFLGQLSDDVYTIDNQNTGLILYDTPKDILATCVNSIVISTSTNSDFVLDKTITSETMNVFIPNVGLTLGSFKVKDAALSVIQSSSIGPNMNNITIGSPNHSALSAGVYHFEFSVTAGALSETIKGQFIIK